MDKNEAWNTVACAVCNPANERVNILERSAYKIHLHGLG